MLFKPYEIGKGEVMFVVEAGWEHGVFADRRWAPTGANNTQKSNL
jgi:hypothetical protein